MINLLSNTVNTLFEDVVEANELLQFATEAGNLGLGGLQLVTHLGDKFGLLTDALAEHGELRQLALDVLAGSSKQLLRLLDLLLQTGTVFLHLLHRLG